MISRRGALHGGALVGASLLLAACSGRGTAPAAPALSGSTDLNPKPRDQVRGGGELRLPLQALPNNFNYNQADGTNADTAQISYALIPSLFVGTEDGGLRLNPDYLTSAQVTATAPHQVVTYTVNPKAVWSDGTPISWRDFEANWKAQNGSNPAFQTSGTTGYSDILSVARGADDRQAIVTYANPIAEWDNLFNPFYPASAYATPAGFNTAYRTSFPVTSGPFVLEGVDQTAKTVTVRRDPKWWGTPAKLDRIIFKAFDTAAQPDALANNELDYYEIGSDLDLLRRAQSTPGAAVRNAPSRYYTQLTFNGAPGALLSDPRLRQAVARSIDRKSITKRMIGQIVSNAQPDGNHIYSPGTKEYRDNSAALPYDPAAAQRALDELGWVRNAATRQRGGTPLNLRLIYVDTPAGGDVAKTVQNQLAQVGITTQLLAYPFNEFDPNVTKGNFDLAEFSWGGTASPLTSSVEIYGSPIGNLVRENYGRVGSPEIDALFAEGIAELDEAKRTELGNRADQLIWRQAHSVVLYVRPGAVAVRANLANYGAFGLADPDYVNAGFVA